MDIVRTADVSLVTLVPGAGDDVQALKAGIMEIADIFIVNKADREGSDRLAASISQISRCILYGPDEWRPPIVRTVATRGLGTDELVGEIARFRARQAPGDHGRRRARAEHRLRECLTQGALRHIERHVLAAGELDTIVDRIASRDVDPYTAADEVLKRALAR